MRKRGNKENSELFCSIGRKKSPSIDRVRLVERILEKENKLLLCVLSEIIIIHLSGNII